MRRRVVMTGLGALSSAGSDLTQASAKFRAGDCCLSAITDPRATHLKARYAGLVGPADLAGAPPELEGADRHVLLAALPAREALASAGVEPKSMGRRLGLIFSTCSGPMLLIEAHYERVLRGEPRLDRGELYAKRYYAGGQVLARWLGVQGLCTTVVTACSASTAAIALGADLIRCGLLDMALAGGSDAFSISTLAGFDGLKATTDGKCAPFSKPFGLNLGEAGAFVFLEEAESARGRGAAIRAELLGSGMSNDAYHCSSPEPSGRGLVLAMQRALLDAGLAPEQITYINAHGTGTEANDKAECKALLKVFGEAAARLPVSSTKSQVGHCLGAAGAIETIASIVCAEAEVLPPTANYNGPREGCRVDCVPQAGQPWRAPRVFLSNNSAFGGHNTSLAIAVRSDGPKGNSSQPSRERIFVTACGVVSALGFGQTCVAEAVRQGQPGCRPVALPKLPAFPAGLVDEAAVARLDRRLDLRNMDRSSQWATVATRLALRQAGLPDKPATLAELGLFLNLSAGPSWAESEYLTSFLSSGHQVKHLLAFPYIVPSSVTGNVCRALRLSGPNLTLSGGPGAGLLGLGPAVSALRTAHTQALLCGAVDELSPRILTDCFLAGLGESEDSWPLGEGAVVLLLETEEHVDARGGTSLAELCGLALAMEPGPERGSSQTPSLCEDVVNEALRQADLRPDAVAAWCGDGPRALLAQLEAKFYPAWAQRRVNTARQTGWLEAGQALLNLAVALPGLPAGASLLAFSSHGPGGTGAAVFKKIDNSLPSPQESRATI